MHAETISAAHDSHPTVIQLDRKHSIQEYILYTQYYMVSTLQEVVRNSYI